MQDGGDERGDLAGVADVVLDGAGVVDVVLDGHGLGQGSALLLVDASKSGVTRTKWRSRMGGEASGTRWKGS